MGYDFTIGEAAIRSPEITECDEVAALTVCVADVVRIADAPNGWNVFEAGYGWWADTMRACGLDDILVRRGRLDPITLLVPDHPGAARLTHNHLARFEAAHDEARSKQHSAAIEATAWLVWWTRWALDNCKIPTLANR